MGEVCPQPVEEVRQCGFRVHFDFGELWGAVTSPLLLFVLLKAAQSGHRHKKKFVAEVSSITPHDNTSGMSQMACGSNLGVIGNGTGGHFWRKRPTIGWSLSLQLFGVNLSVRQSGGA